MTDKTKSQTYNFLSENKSIEDLLKQKNIFVKEIKNKRHSGKTYRIDNDNNQQLKNEQIQIIDENLEIVHTILTDNEKEQETNNDIWTKFINYLNWPTSNTEELIQTQKKYIEQLEQNNLEKNKQIQQLKKENEELNKKQSNVNFDKFKYNAVTIYNEKQKKDKGIEKIHEEILPINNKIYFITTIQNIDNSINEEIIHFYQLTNGNVEVIKQVKEYENIKKYKNDFSLIEENSNHEKNIKIEPVSIKKFLSEQEKISNWKISKSEWIIFISLSLLSITLLAIPVVVPVLVPIISTILWEKTLVSIVGIGIAWIVNKGIWTIATEKTKKVESWMKQNFYTLIRKIPFVNKRNLGKTKEELEIKKNVENTIKNLTSDKLETKLETEFNILKQELNNRKNNNSDELINNNKINHNSNNISQNLSIESENNHNFDSSIRDTVNHHQQPTTNSNHNWNKVKCLLT